MSRTRSPVRDLLDMLWQQPFWALPFAIFFALIYAPTWPGLAVNYKLALVFSFARAGGTVAPPKSKATDAGKPTPATPAPRRRPAEGIDPAHHQWPGGGESLESGPAFHRL
jgi:hypothetical protein